MPQTLHLAKIIITNTGEPIFNGGVLVDNSKIISVGKKEDFGNTDVEIIDHGDALICPGFINLHAHLLYSNVKKPTEQISLFQWLEKLFDEIKTWKENDYKRSINYGIDQLLSSGTTFVVENTPNLLSANELAKSPLKALIGLEVFSSDEERVEEIFSFYLSNLTSHPSSVDLTLSPHAPYDVSAPLWRELIKWSEENNKLLLTHLEESPDEKLWWQKKSGDCVNFWKKINHLEPKLKYWERYDSGIDFLNKKNLLSKNIIATHLSCTTKEDLKILKDHDIKLVHSPRSNFYLKNGTANIKLWNELGFLWGIGTDSLASNDSLDLLDEIRFAIKQQEEIYNYKLSAHDAFLAITKSPAEIIRKDSKIGSLKKRCYADFLVYDIQGKPDSTYRDPYYELIFNTNNKKDLKEVWINGKKVWVKFKHACCNF